MKIQRFIKTPKKGDVIKVFDSLDGFSYFGIAEKIEIKTHKSKVLKSNSEIGKVRKEISAMLSNIYKEDRENKKERFYVGNGNTFWTDGIIKAVKREKSNAETPDNKSDFDFAF